MADNEEVTVSELRDRLPDIVYQTLAHKQTFIITKYGKPFAKVCPIDDPGERDRAIKLIKDLGAETVAATDPIDEEAGIS